MPGPGAYWYGKEEMEAALDEMKLAVRTKF